MITTTTPRIILASYAEKGDEPRYIHESIAAQWLNAARFMGIEAEIITINGMVITTDHLPRPSRVNITNPIALNRIYDTHCRRVSVEYEEYLPEGMEFDVIEEYDGTYLYVGSWGYYILPVVEDPTRAFGRSVQWVAYDFEGDQMCRPTQVQNALFKAITGTFACELGQKLSVKGEIK